MSSYVGRAAIASTTLGYSEYYPFLKKPRNRASAPVGKAVTLGASTLVDKKLDVPKPPAPEAPATADDKAVQQVVAEGAQRRSRARGYRSTILSQNFLSPSPNKDLASTFGA